MVKITGDRIEFTAGHTKYSGRIQGNTIEGTYKRGDNSGTWRATKVDRKTQSAIKK